MEEEGGGGLIGLRKASLIEKGEEGGDCWTGLLEAGPVEGREEEEGYWIEAGPVGEGEKRGGMWTGLREAGPVEGEDRTGAGLVGEAGRGGVGLSGVDPVGEEERRWDWSVTRLREAGLVGEGGGGE